MLEGRKKRRKELCQTGDKKALPIKRAAIRRTYRSQRLHRPAKQPSTRRPHSAAAERAGMTTPPDFPAFGVRGWNKNKCVSDVKQGMPDQSPRDQTNSPQPAHELTTGAVKASATRSGSGPGMQIASSAVAGRLRKGGREPGGSRAGAREGTAPPTKIMAVAVVVVVVVGLWLRDVAGLGFRHQGATVSLFSIFAPMKDPNTHGATTAQE